MARLRTVCACGSVATAPWLTWTTTCSAVEFRLGELLAQDRPGLDRLAAAVLPARSGQLLLYLRREGIQHPHDDELAANHDAQMGSGPAAQSGDPAGFVGLRDRSLQAGGCADHDDFSTVRGVEADR